jgi:nicotinamide-nucleotide amidase
MPIGAVLIPNQWGTAPSFYLENESSLIVFMPGVPLEMKKIVGSFVEPKIKAKFPSNLGILKTTIIKAAGLGESLVDDRLGDLIRGSENPSLGLLAGIYETRVLITVKADNQSHADSLQTPLIEEIKTRLGDHYVGIHPETLVTAACSLINQKGLRLGLIDNVTSGTAIDPFLEALAPQCLAGALTVASEAIEGGLDLFFNKLKADLVAVISGALTAEATENEAETQTTFRLLIKGADGAPPSEAARGERTFGGVAEIVKSRIGSYLAYNLWNWLKQS